jgi:hypothetical protein
MEGTQGAYPAADHPPQDKSEDDSKSCKNKRYENCAGSDKSCQSKKGIEVEKNFHPSYIIFSREVSSEE